MSEVGAAAMSQGAALGETAEPQGPGVGLSAGEAEASVKFAWKEVPGVG